MNNILTQTEIQQITGMKTPSRQLQWLHENGYMCAKLNYKNEIIMSTLYFHQASGAAIEAMQKVQETKSVVDFDALQRLMGE